MNGNGDNRPSPFDRCMKYLAKCPDAISGQGGHKATIHAACVCFRFGLPGADAWRAMQWFNENKTGGTSGRKWTDRDLQHKLADAKKKVEAAGDFGSLLKADGKTPAPARPKTTAAKPTTPAPAATPAKPRTADKAMEAAGRWVAKEHPDARLVATWQYPGDTFRVGRFNFVTDGKPDKTFRPIHRLPDGAGWALGDPPGLLPLYRGDELPATGPIAVCEGEKATDAARSIGLAAVASAHGAKSARKTDWRPLAGREVWIFPDNDAAGRGYAADVAAILAGLGCTVRIVTLPALPDHGDIVDWLTTKSDAADPDDLKAEIVRLAQAAPNLAPAASVNTMSANPAKSRVVLPLPAYVPFPVDALPEPIRAFVKAASKAIGCDPAFVALPLLTGFASAIGNSRRIQLRRVWTEPAILWTGCIGESGDLKSPGQDAALGRIHHRQGGTIKRYEQANELFEQELANYEEKRTERRRGKAAGQPPAKPVAPICERFITSDTTIESLALLLLNAPRGLLVARDELAGLLNSFDAYKQGKGDAAHWIELHGGRPLIVDRKSAKPPMIYVPRAAASITGGIQPGTLQRALGTEHFENGLAARFLWAMPPRRPRVWTEAEIPPDVETRVSVVFDKLYGLQFGIDAQGEPVPVNVPLSADGKAAWIPFVNEHGREHLDLTGDLAAAWSKLEGYAARLALVVHFVRWAAGDPTLADADAIDAESIGTGVALSRWFGDEAKRVYCTLSESDEQRERRELLSLIRDRGGRITPRELQAASRRYRNDAETAELALNALVKAELGRWIQQEPGPKGGRPVSVFELANECQR